MNFLSHSADGYFPDLVDLIFHSRVLPVLARREPLFFSSIAQTSLGGIFYGIITPKAAVYTAARVRCTRSCAGAQSFGGIEPCKTAAGAVLL